MTKLKSINPSDRSLLGEVEITTPKEITNAVDKARKALFSWKQLGVQGRVKHLRKVVSQLEKRADEFSKLISKEMGMPISQSKHDIHGAIEYFNWYLDNAKKYLSSEVVYEDESMIHKVLYEPYGVVAVITPWNFPASNFVWMVGQNLLVGNTVVFKASEEVPFCGKLIEEVFRDAEIPEGVFSEVYGDGEVGNLLVQQDINLICFTGSTTVGQNLYKIAADKFIKVLLELGGSAPGIVFEDSDIDKVLETIYANRFDNCGQICDGLKRLIVHESKLRELVKKLTTKLGSVCVGDATDEKTDIGPLATEKQLDNLKEQMHDALEKGANVAFQGKIPNETRGFFYPPTILTKISFDMKVWTEEVFGPVLPIVTFKTEQEALKLANDTRYGLGGYVFTKNKERFEKVASQIESGMVQMNNASYVCPSSPFGGIKASGMGREHGKFGFQELSQIKLVSIEK